jgi:hypothetical protein
VIRTHDTSVRTGEYSSSPRRVCSVIFPGNVYIKKEEEELNEGTEKKKIN